MIETDVLIVGGGPAGAACAWQLRRHHIDCLVLDQAAFPRFKPCAGWMSPEAVQTIRLEQEGYPHGLTVIDRFHFSLRGVRFSIHARQYAIRRVEFDDWLLKSAGVPVYQHSVRSIVQSGGRYIIDGEYAGKYLVGAGGTYCPVYRTFFKERAPRPRAALVAAQEEEFLYPYTDSACYLWFMENQLPGYAWYVPKAGGYLNVGVGGLAEPMKASGISLKQHWERLVRQLEEIGLVRGHAYTPSAHSYYLRRAPAAVQLGGAYLAGDAAGLATSDLGEGIGAALRSGQLAADAIALGSPYTPKTLRSLQRYSLLSFARAMLDHPFLED